MPLSDAYGWSASTMRERVPGDHSLSLTVVDPPPAGRTPRGRKSPDSLIIAGGTSRAVRGPMSNDLSTLDLHALAAVTGGASKATEQELKLAMTNIKDSLSSLKKTVTSSSSGDPMQMMMMMMMMKR
jgi:hypothetical protein